MANQNLTFGYNMNSENSYLRLFQIANQNLNLLLKEEDRDKPVVPNFSRSVIGVKLNDWKKNPVRFKKFETVRKRELS